MNVEKESIMVDICAEMQLHFLLRLKMETKMIPCSVITWSKHSHPCALTEATHSSTNAVEARRDYRSMVKSEKKQG